MDDIRTGTYTSDYLKLTIALVSDDEPAILLRGMLGDFVRCVFLEFLSGHFDDSLNTQKKNARKKNATGKATNNALVCDR
jgi:hypothetical protein